MEIIDKKYLIGAAVGLGLGACLGAGIATAIVLASKKQEENVDRALDEDADAVLLDLDGDGEPDVLLEDTTGDGNIDTISVDTTGDGEIDTVMIDVDGDGEPDVIYTSNEELEQALNEAEAQTLESELFDENDQPE